MFKMCLATREHLEGCEFDSLRTGALFQGSSCQCVFITALSDWELSLFLETQPTNAAVAGGGRLIMFG